jgi:hypothetical protein
MHARWLIALSILTLTACGEGQLLPKGEKGDRGPPGPAGPAGAPGPAGASGTAIRFIDAECPGGCIVSCEANERILIVFAHNPGGSLTFEDENKATFRPQRAGTPTKLSVACVPK